MDRPLNAKGVSTQSNGQLEKLYAPGSTKLLFAELTPLEPPAWPADQLLACCCGAARCGAARTGAAARSLFGGASSAMACPMTINVESTPTPEISNFLITTPLRRPYSATSK